MRRHFRRIQSWRSALIYSASYHFEAFFVAAIATVLVIRFLLKVSGYPQLGGGGLHIAHVLYGGFLMLIALVIQMMFLGDRPRSLAALLGGVGFGFFIDELGKYVTKNNDYFFKPAALLIYGLFLLLWMAFRIFNERRSTSQLNHMANILELLQEGILYGLNKQERAEIYAQLEKLKHSKNVLVPELTRLVAKVEDRARIDSPSLYIRLISGIEGIYSWAIEQAWFAPFLYLVFLTQGVLSLAPLVSFASDWLGGNNVLDIHNEVHRAQLGQLFGGVVYSLLVIWGLFMLRRNRIAGYVIFKRALLTNIFITQFFAFYRLGFAAATGLIFNLMILGAVDYLIMLERHRLKGNSYLRR